MTEDAILIGMTTAPRPGCAHYLDRTAESLVRWIPTPRQICLAIHSEPPARRWGRPGQRPEGLINVDILIRLTTLFRDNPFQLGNWRNWVSTAEHMLALEERLRPEGVPANQRMIMLIEDDIDFGPGLQNGISFDWLEGTFHSLARSSDFGLISLYTSKVYREVWLVLDRDGVTLSAHRTRQAAVIKHCRGDGQRVVHQVREDGLWRIDHQDLCGACALVFSAESLRRVIESDFARSWQGPSGRSDHLVGYRDTAIGRACKSLGLGKYFLIPSPVEHIGDVSTWTDQPNTGKRRAIPFSDAAAGDRKESSERNSG